MVADVADAFADEIHSLTDDSKASVASDFDRDCIENAGARRGAGDVLFTISVSHCSAFGSGFVAAIGTTWKNILLLKIQDKKLCEIYLLW